MIIHNNCTFKIVRYFDDKAIIEIKPINGTFTSGLTAQYQTELVDNITSLGFEEWVKNNF